jgi:hypothetical protein
MAMNLEFGICRKNPIGRSGSQNVAQKKLLAMIRSHQLVWDTRRMIMMMREGIRQWPNNHQKLSREKKASERAMQINSLAYLHSQGCGIDHPSTEMFLANLGFPH